MFQAINLDDLTVDHGEMSEAAMVLGKLSEYAGLKCTSMRLREQGNICAAGIVEDKMQRLYAGLPGWARW